MVCIGGLWLVKFVNYGFVTIAFAFGTMGWHLFYGVATLADVPVAFAYGGGVATFTLLTLFKVSYMGNGGVRDGFRFRLKHGKWHTFYAVCQRAQTKPAFLSDGSWC